MNKNKKIKIIQVVPNLNVSGGVQKYVLNLVQNIDRSRFQVDIAHHNWQNFQYCTDKSLREKFKDCGCNIHELPNAKQNFLGFLKGIDRVYSQCSDFDILHVNSMGTSSFFLRKASKYNFKARIFQAHDTKLSEKKIYEIRNKILLKKSLKYSTHKLAVSKKAGESVFKNLPFTTVHSCINRRTYKFSDFERKKIREKYKINDSDFVIGFVGRFCLQKNVLFALDVFSEYLKTEKNAKFIFVGEGPLTEELQKRSCELQISNSVIFAGHQENIRGFYSAFDLLLLPSNYEGLGLVAVEAQYSGLPCVLSDVVPEDADIGSCKFLSLNDNLENWASCIHNAIIQNNTRFPQLKNTFDPKSNIIKLQNYYLDAIKDR